MAKLLDVNFMGAVFFTREALKHMKKGSSIVNVSSIHAVETSRLVAPYAAAKAALYRSRAAPPSKSASVAYRPMP